MTQREELEVLGFEFKSSAGVAKNSRADFSERYIKLCKWLQEQNIAIPISIEPYTEEERQKRENLPEIFWGPRDYEDLGMNRCENCGRR